MYAIRMIRKLTNPVRVERSYVVDGFRPGEPRAEFRRRADAERLADKLDAQLCDPHRAHERPEYRVVRVS